jgi:hypothetical protein
MEEKVKFIYELTKGHKHSGKDFFDHLKNTSDIIKEWFPQEQYLIDAGLYHSVYGTQSYHFKERVTRDQVKKLIGEKSEKLAFVFCSLPNRVNRILEHNFTSDVQKDLYILEYANQLEQSDVLDNQDVISKIRCNLKKYYDTSLNN